MKIICIGRNYVDHAKELNNEVPIEPIFFLKPETALIERGRPFFYPEFSKDIHHEVEVVVKINKVGKYIEERFAHTYYSEISLGIDFTARDLQQECKKNGLPWEKAKAFDGSAPIGKFIPKENLDLENGFDFLLTKNMQKVQVGNTKHMLFSIDKIIAHVSQYITLKKGDLIFTGTPAGVGPIAKGDRLVAFIDNNLMLSCNVR
jgi:acylpyruvate hydrolase